MQKNVKYFSISLEKEENYIIKFFFHLQLTVHTVRTGLEPTTHQFLSEARSDYFIYINQNVLDSFIQIAVCVHLYFIYNYRMPGCSTGMKQASTKNLHS